MAQHGSNRGMLIFLLVVLLFVGGYYFGRDGLIFPPSPPPPIEGTGGETPIHGDFSSDLDVRDTYLRNGVNAVLGFELKSDLPPCNSIGLVQMVRTIDLDEPNQSYYYPSLQKKLRATKNGWYIDRGEGYDCVFYGMKNNNTQFELYVTPPELLSIKRTMIDRPYRPQNHPYFGIRWQAVTVAVCIDEGSEREGHGYYAWSWTVTKKGAVEDEKAIRAKNSLQVDFTDALSKWFEKHPPETTKCGSSVTFTLK